MVATNVTKHTMLCFIVALSVFALLGLWLDTALKWVLMVTAVLMLHEAGHAVAMRMFGYKNVALYLVPFLGAVTTGIKNDSRGYQRVIVYLMGPLPGMVLGFALLMIPALRGHALVLEFAILLVSINLLNLLPVPPLDGGQIVRDTVFARFPALETACHVFGALAIMLLFGPIGWIIGLALLFGASGVYKTAKLRRVLRDMLADRVGNSVKIPAECTRACVAGLINDGTASLPLKRLRLGLSLIQSAFVRPPGILQSAGLLTVYAVSLALPVLLGLLIGVQQLARSYEIRLVRSCQSEELLELKQRRAALIVESLFAMKTKPVVKAQARRLDRCFRVQGGFKPTARRLQKKYGKLKVFSIPVSPVATAL